MGKTATTGGGGAPMYSTEGKLLTHRIAFTHNNAADPVINVHKASSPVAPAVQKLANPRIFCGHSIEAHYLLWIRVRCLPR